METEIVLAKVDSSGQFVQNPYSAAVTQGSDYFVGTREFGDYKTEAKVVLTGKDSLIPSSLDAKGYIGAH